MFSPSANDKFAVLRLRWHASVLRWAVLLLLVAGVMIAGVLLIIQQQNVSNSRAASNSSAIQQALVVDNRDLELGRVWPDDQFPCEIKITNASREAIDVQRLAASCQCVSVEPSEFVLQPSQSIALQLVLDLASQSHSHVDLRDRPFEIQLYAVDRQAREFYWTMRGTIVPPCRIEPAFIDLGELLEGDALPSATINVRTLDPRDSVAVRQAPPWLAVNLRRSSSAAPNWEAIVTLKRHPPIGPINAAFSLQIKSPQRQSKGMVQVRLTGKSVNDIRIEPLPLTFGVLAPGERSEAVLTFASRSAKPIEVEVLQAPDDLRIEPLDTTAPYQRRFRLVYTAPRRQGAQTVLTEFKIRYSNGRFSVVGVSGTAFIGAPVSFSYINARRE